MKKILVILFFPIICFADWNSVSINSSWDLNAIHFADENIGYAVGLDGLVIKSTDGGSNWISLGNIIWNGSLLNRDIIVSTSGMTANAYIKQKFKKGGSRKKRTRKRTSTKKTKKKRSKRRKSSSRKRRKVSRKKKAN